MSYSDALTLAGGEVLNFRYFGSYSGRWYAQVSYEGEVGWVSDSFGSCTVCDAFQADLGHLSDHPDYDKYVADFGRTYLEALLPAEHFLKELRDRLGEYAGCYVDTEAEDAIEWIEKIEGNQ
jgi:hypothetical protein